MIVVPPWERLSRLRRTGGPLLQLSAVCHGHGSDIRGIPPWSSFRYYATEAEGRVEIESEWTARRRKRAAGRRERRAFSPSGSYRITVQMTQSEANRRIVRSPSSATPRLRPQNCAHGHSMREGSRAETA